LFCRRDQLEDTMDYSKTLEELKHASLFDLYRLSVAINQLLEGPRRLFEIKACLRSGQNISYFDDTENLFRPLLTDSRSLII
jgi:hypothetical protein